MVKDLFLLPNKLYKSKTFSAQTGILSPCSLRPDLLSSEIEDYSHGSVHLLATVKVEKIRHHKKCGVETNLQKQKPS